MDEKTECRAWLHQAVHVNAVIEAGFTLQGFALFPSGACTCTQPLLKNASQCCICAWDKLLSAILWWTCERHPAAVEYLSVRSGSTTAAYVLLHLKSVFRRSYESNSVRIQALFSPLASVQRHRCLPVRRSKVRAPGHLLLVSVWVLSGHSSLLPRAESVHVW